jgi:hypothetical protein
MVWYLAIVEVILQVFVLWLVLCGCVVDILTCDSSALWCSFAIYLCESHTFSVLSLYHVFVIVIFQTSVRIYYVGICFLLFIYSFSHN